MSEEIVRPGEVNRADERRLNLVEKLLIRKLDANEIRQALAQLNDPIMVDMQTVVEDILEVQKIQRERTLLSLGDIAQEELASINELERICWKEKNYPLVLRAKQLKVRLLVAAYGKANFDDLPDPRQFNIWDAPQKEEIDELDEK